MWGGVVTDTETVREIGERDKGGGGRECGGGGSGGGGGGRRDRQEETHTTQRYLGTFPHQQNRDIESKVIQTLKPKN